MSTEEWERRIDTATSGRGWDASTDTRERTRRGQRTGSRASLVVLLPEIARDDSRDDIGVVARVWFSGSREDRSPVSKKCKARVAGIIAQIKEKRGAGLAQVAQPAEERTLKFLLKASEVVRAWFNGDGGAVRGRRDKQARGKGGE